jgi:hypothetical protein
LAIITEFPGAIEKLCQSMMPRALVCETVKAAPDVLMAPFPATNCPPCGSGPTGLASAATPAEKSPDVRIRLEQAMRTRRNKAAQDDLQSRRSAYAFK